MAVPANKPLLSRLAYIIRGLRSREDADGGPLEIFSDIASTILHNTSFPVDICVSFDQNSVEFVNVASQQRIKQAAIAEASIL